MQSDGSTWGRCTCTVSIAGSFPSSPGFESRLGMFYDRGDKFAAYRRFAGLKTVLFLSQDRAHVECFTRGEDGRWVLSEASGETARLALPAFDFELALADLYRDLPDAEASDPAPVPPPSTPRPPPAA